MEERVQAKTGSPYLVTGNGDLQLHFSPANGYPPGAYTQLLEQLGEISRVTASALRPLWPGQDPLILQHWGELAVDLDNFLSGFPLPQGSWIGVGHSVGATISLKAALNRPGLFRALILIDPPFFSPWFIHFWKAVLFLGLGNRIHPLAPRALRRRRVFSSKDEMFAKYRQKRVFRHLSDAALEYYVASMARPASGTSVELAYSPEWEARIYVTSAVDDLRTWQHLPRLNIPVLFIRGSKFPTFSTQTFHRFKRSVPQAQLIDVPGATHLVALERPDQVCEIIHSKIKEWKISPYQE